MPPRQFAVIGLGRFGYHVAQALSQAGREVLALDRDAEKIQSVSDFVTYAVQCDATDEKALRETAVQNVDMAVVSVGKDLEASILIVMTLRELGLKDIVAKAISPIHGKVLTNLGVKRVVYPEKESAVRVVHGLIAPNQLEYLELAPGYSIVEIPVPRSLAGKALKESRIRTLYGVNVMTIKKSGPQGEVALKINPGPEDRLDEGDLIVVIGKDKDIEWLSNLQ